MKKETKSLIPDTYWKTAESKALCNIMHDEGWEALDCLNIMLNCMEETIKKTADSAIKEEIKKARQKIMLARNCVRNAHDILSNKMF